MFSYTLYRDYLILPEAPLGKFDKPKFSDNPGQSSGNIRVTPRMWRVLSCGLSPAITSKQLCGLKQLICLCGSVSLL